MRTPVQPAVQPIWRFSTFCLRLRRSSQAREVTTRYFMNGAHDLGGMMGVGPVVPEKDEPVFHAVWERRAFALNLPMTLRARGTFDQWRAARESLHPAEYHAKSYYGTWITA